LSVNVVYRCLTQVFRWRMKQPVSMDHTYSAWTISHVRRLDLTSTNHFKQNVPISLSVNSVASVIYHCSSPCGV